MIEPLGTTASTALAFDDNPDREQMYRLMEDENLIIHFVNLKEQDTVSSIKSLDNQEPSIIFVDHRLDNTSEESVKFMPTGKSITPILRDKWKKPPIFGVTAVPQVCLEHDGNTFYEEVFDINDISTLQDFIPSIISGYKQIREISRVPVSEHDQSVAGFVGLLNAPEGEDDSIIHAIPDELRILEADSFSHAIYRWFRRTLHDHSGFLYDDNWASVTIGVADEYFHLYAPKLEDALYSGIWSDPSKLRWWKKTLYKKALDSRGSPREPLQQSACQSFGIQEEHFSKCNKCGGKWPEVMAFSDDGVLAQLVPAHISCSIPHPRRFISHSFEEPRIIE